MKFLCDRCKTRYSIADERVRGKILKIRCKNCANVITVREGMPEPDEPSVVAQRPKRNTQIIPDSAISTNHSQVAPMPKAAPAPAALEEEWYVSIDGDQSGPFSLAEAQAWVASKPYDAELHCWSEGFDDWLPVDKVSHFRGLRKARPAPPPAPSRDRSNVARLPLAPAPVEDEPKPLFAATMASIEKAAEKSAPMPVARANGAASGPVHKAVIPPKPAGIVAKPAAPSPSAPIPAAAPSAFDTSEPAEREAHDDGLFSKPAATPNASKSQPLAVTIPAKPAQHDPPLALPGPEPIHALPAPNILAALPPAPDLDDDADDDMQIGEVSRVVNLADLMKQRPAARTDGTGAVRRVGQPNVNVNTGSFPRVPSIAKGATGSFARVQGGTGAFPRVTGAHPVVGSEPVPFPLAPAEPASDGEATALAAQMQSAKSHRRAMVILFSVAGALLAGVIVAVVLLVTRADDGSIGTLGGHGYAIDTTRPDDRSHPQLPGSAGAAQPENPFVPRRPTRPVNPTNTNPQHVETPTPPEDPNLKALRPEEVEAMAADHSGGTQRCYMRAQKGAEAILVGDVKKIAVTLSVDKAGAVTDVALSDHAADSLGKCLSATIRSWKFRASSNGITAKITMVFATE